MQYNQTNIHPLALVAVLILGLATLVVPRKWVLLPVMLLACFIPFGQRLVVFTLDFTFFRLIVMFAWVRIMLRGEHKVYSTNPVDWMVIAWIAVTVVARQLLWGDMGTFILSLGMTFDTLGMYFMLRLLIRSWADLDRVTTFFIWISVPVVFAFLIENSTGRNAFAVFGGVPEITLVREGRLRCQGAFSHPILAGCFWAAILPLIVSRWWAGKNARLSTIVGTVCVLGIIKLCGSSTPIMSVGGAVVAGFAFLIRYHLTLIRWGTVMTLVALHIVMKAPVWHLIARIDMVGGSTGWHRYHLIDRTIAHFPEWFLIGTKSTWHWGRNLGDLTNEYAVVGVNGGVLGLIFFLLIIAFSFKHIGVLWRATWPNRRATALAWASGVSLFVHCISFVGVSYFGQIEIVWFLTIASIASLTNTTQAAAVKSRIRARETVQGAATA